MSFNVQHNHLQIYFTITRSFRNQLLSCQIWTKTPASHHGDDSASIRKLEAFRKGNLMEGKHPGEKTFFSVSQTQLVPETSI